MICNWGFSILIFDWRRGNTSTQATIRKSSEVINVTYVKSPLPSAPCSMVPIFPNFLGRFKRNGGCTIATPFLALGIQCDCGHVTISMDLRRILTKEKKDIERHEKTNDPKTIAYSLFVFPLRVFGHVKYISGHVCCCIFQIHRLVHTSGNGNFWPVSFGRCYRPNPEKTLLQEPSHTNPQHPNIQK